MTSNMTLADYFYEWMETFKKPAVTSVTYIKYENTHAHILAYYGETTLENMTRQIYQAGLNAFAKNHAKRTTAGFHKHIRCAVLDALEEKLITTDFTRKAVITGTEKQKEKAKFHAYGEWESLVQHTSENMDNPLNLIIFLSAVTGMRFAEVLGLTVADIDFKAKILRVNKTWDYKYHTGFKPTKNPSSIRNIDLDSRTLKVLKQVLGSRKMKLPDAKLCVDPQNKLPASATINRYLSKLCDDLEINRISFHGIRHTHASVLLFKGVNILSVSKRLGHQDISTTQSVYLHIIKEMEERETKLITKVMKDAMNF